MQRNPLAVLLAGLYAMPAPALAQDAYQLDDIVVTATRTAQTADASLASVTVITRKDIERSQAVSLDEILRGVPDLDVARNGGYGKNTAVYLRGTNAGHVLVLVDGVRAASATLGTFAWQDLSPEQIERIEIVRGPRAALYGSDAVGGVVQIFTRKVKGGYARAGLGSHSTRSVGAGIGGGEAWRYSLSAGHFSTDGIPTNKVFSADHGYDNSHLAAGLAGQIGAGLKLNLDVSHAEGRNELDAGTGDEDYRHQVASARLEQRLSDNWSQRLTVGYALDDYTTHSVYLPANIVTRRTSLAWQHDFVLAGGGLSSVGLDYWRDEADKDGSGDIHQALDTAALFAQHQWQALGSDWLLGLRHDRHDSFGGKTTGSLGWGMDLSPRTRVTASWGTAFKAPSVNDLYWPHSADTYYGSTYVTEGNPDLRPETSHSLELGLRHRLEAGISLGASLYRTRIEDLIEWQGSQTGADEYTYRPANVSRAAIDGLDLTAGGSLGGWRLGAGATLLKAEDAATGRQLDRRPRRKLALRLGHDLGRGSWQAEWLLAGARNDRNGSTRLDGYGIVNLTWRQPLPGDLELQARLENLFDRDYVLASSYSGDYNSLGRSLFVTLQYQPR